MRSATRALVGAAMLAMARGQGVIISAQGESGKSTAFAVDPKNPADANFISDSEIGANLVNECGRTLAHGNIDVGEGGETALAAGAVTKVTKGSTVKITIAQGGEKGVGPYTCDMDPQGNTLSTGQTVLQVKETDTGGTTTLVVTMPANLACTGSSAGNVCTIRCRNAHDFGGCVAVQQTDVVPLAGDNAPANIRTAAAPAAADAQARAAQRNLAAAVAGNHAAAGQPDAQGRSIAQSILASDPAIVAAVEAELRGKAANATAKAGAGSKGTGKGNGKGKGKGKGTGTKGTGQKGTGQKGTAAEGAAATKAPKAPKAAKGTKAATTSTNKVGGRSTSRRFRAGPHARRLQPDPRYVVVEADAKGATGN